MYLIFHIIVAAACLFFFTVYEDELEEMNMDFLADKEVNWLSAILWPLAIIYFVPIGLGLYIKHKRNNSGN